MQTTTVMYPLFAASSWPIGVLLAAPVFVILFVLASRCAQNSRQRMANLLFGFFGSLVAYAAVLSVDESRIRWMEDYLPIIIPTIMIVGAIVGVAFLALIRKILSLVVRRLPSSPPDSTRRS
jgi:hypothetical protein